MPFPFANRDDEGRGARIRELEGELRLLRNRHEQFVAFVHSFPEMTRDLLGARQIRDFPARLLEVCRRAFEPEAALVAMRRSSAGQGPERRAHFIVAAAHGLSIGSEIVEGRGLCGGAAESRRVMNRKEWESLPAVVRGRAASEAEEDLFPELELAAPMVVDDEVLGLVAVGRTHRHLAQAKEMGRLLAQIGGHKLQSLEDLVTIRNAANLDGLTGILNKRTITHLLSEAVFAAESEETPLSIFLFDIDHFKNYNDTQGHVAGDRLLRDLAVLVKSRIRREHHFGRFGGEEFLLVLQGCETSSALIAAENVRRVLASHPFEGGDEQPLGHLSISGGVACLFEHGRSSTDLLRAADAALYEAKRSGRDRICLAGS